MSIQSIKIKIGNEIKELTIKEAKALKDALDELFPQRPIHRNTPIIDYTPKQLPKYPPFDTTPIWCGPQSKANAIATDSTTLP